MAELRWYAVGIAEVRGVFGASADTAPHLRELARQALAPTPAAAGQGGLLAKLGPIFRRPPAAPVISPTQPEPHDLEVLLAGAYVPPERTGATWRLLETLVCGMAWGATRLDLDPARLDQLDFALARAGVPAAVGLRHLLDSPLGVPLVPVAGLRVGWHPYETVLATAGAYRAALAQLEDPDVRELVGALATWLDGFLPWAQVAPSLRRPVPDLVGFWAS